MNRTAAYVIHMIASNLKLDPASVTEAATLDELGVDSLRAISILYDIEDSFEIEIPNEDIQKLESVGDIIEIVRGLV
jgi:acyl carrier protein